MLSKFSRMKPQEVSSEPGLLCIEEHVVVEDENLPWICFLIPKPPLVIPFAQGRG